MLPERVTGVDLAWRRMDSNVQHANIVSLMVLDGELSRADLARTFERAIARDDRFVARMRFHSLFGATWERDPQFDIDRHVVDAPATQSEAAMRALISDLASEPFDRDHPLWRVMIAPWPGGGTAIVSKVHHCVADGVALVRVLLGLTDEASPAPPEVGYKPPQARGTIAKLTQVATSVETLARTLSLRADPPSVLRGPIGPRKVVAWSKPFELSRLKAMGAMVSGTVNDAVTAIVAGGVERHAREQGRPLERDVRAMVPVFVSGAHGAKSLGNAFGLCYAALPRANDPMSRLREAKARMDVIKATPETSNAVSVMGLLGWLSPALQRLGVRMFTAKSSLVLTNVPGPPVTIHLLGHALRTLIVWAPFAGDLALSVTAVSMHGELRVGVLADAQVIGDPEALVHAIERAFDELSALTTSRATAVAPH